ncbi:mediator of RNA polymerase II transcription subunit 17-like [Panonychus citri]|uniref:mediator of RNA polymerase II transcription subunit 17-like n=1 Tax=Panonychus citri TaxID=50023 RepID=UPI0023078D91|nr:mediator of RNA polymerase II transcription subunit 17-like [Panonychus citri]
MSSQYSVPVSIEISDEYTVQEVTYDGQEKYQSPLTMSENLARMVQRIDFSSIESDDGESEGNSFDSSKESTPAATVTAPQWPWEAARNKIRGALTEVHVLEDVLNIAKEKKYLVLDPVSQDLFENKPVVSLVAKKKAFASAATIITSGVERIKQSKNDASRSQTSDFHTELMCMRQSWRLRRAGNSIIGDLSYRSAGSWYPHLGNFEVTKNEDPPSSTPLSPPMPSIPGTSPSGPVAKQSALKVKIPSDLEGVAYIHVCIQEGRKDLDDDPIKPSINQEALIKMDLSWQQKLENAQNILFCKELFAKLAQEAVQVQFPIPTLIYGNIIIATLFTGTQLNIGLVHQTPPKKKRKFGKSENPEGTEKSSEPVKFPHKPVLEHTLHQLLRDMHYNALHHPMPHPTTATLGLSRVRYFAGPEAYDRHILTESCKNETMLEQILSQSQHYVLRGQVLKTIDDLTKEVKETIIVVHGLCLNSPTRSCIKLNLISRGYEALHRTPATIHITSKRMYIICREGKKYNLYYDMSLLRQTLLTIISHHQMFTIQSMCKLMGWRVLSFTNNCGLGPVEQSGTASAIQIASPNDERIISIRQGPTSEPKVSVSSIPRDQDFYPSSIIRDRKWQNIQSNFKTIDLTKMQGKNLINKIEILMSFTSKT